MLTVLLLTLLNPRLKTYQDAHYDEPVLYLYIDSSMSMYPYAEKVGDFFNEVRDWPGQLKLHTFDFTLKSITIEEEDRFEDIPIGWTGSPSLFTPLQEDLTFTDQTHYYAVVSDFLFRDGFVDLAQSRQGEGGKTGYTNLFYFHPGNGNAHSDSSAVFIRNRDNRIYPDGSYPLKFLFYSSEPIHDIHYRVYYQTANTGDKIFQIKTGKVTTENHYFEIEENLSFPDSTGNWIHLGVEILDEKAYSDQINLLSPIKKTTIEIIYFQINRDVFAIKNSLDRYRDYQVETLYLGGKTSPEMWRGYEKQINALSEERDIFFLIGAPSNVLEWFRTKKIPFIHIPTGSHQVSNWENIRSIDLDYELSPIDFLGEKKLSERRWREVSPQLRGIPRGIMKRDIVFHRSQGKSAFFLREYEMYWGIRNLFFLNNNILQDEEESYWDLFLIETIDFFKEHLEDQEKEVSHNFFLGEKVSDTALPHLVQFGDGYYISPELSIAGVYPSPKEQPPFNYRISLYEFFPPPITPVNYSDPKQFLSWMTTLKDNPIPQVEREITFRERPLYGYLVMGMIALFLILLLLKWYDSQRVTS